MRSGKTLTSASLWGHEQLPQDVAHKPSSKLDVWRPLAF
jgi:hypothetical protein